MFTRLYITPADMSYGYFTPRSGLPTPQPLDQGLRFVPSRPGVLAVPSKIQGASPFPPGDPYVGHHRGSHMASMKNAAIIGLGAFLVAKYGLESETTKSLLVAAGAGAGAYYLLEHAGGQKHAGYC
jgi:hypothetical protein